MNSEVGEQSSRQQLDLAFLFHFWQLLGSRWGAPGGQMAAVFCSLRRGHLHSACCPILKQVAIFAATSGHVWYVLELSTEPLGRGDHAPET